MHVQGRPDKGLSYQCRKWHGKMTCPKAASLRTRLADAHVERLVLDAFSPHGYLSTAVPDGDAAREAQQHLEEAQHELNAYVSTTAVSIVGEQAFERGLEERQGRLEIARAAMAEADAKITTLAPLLSGNLVEAWPRLAVGSKRRILRAFIDRVTIAPAQTRGQRSGHEKRIQVVLLGNVLLVPTEGSVMTATSPLL